MSESSLDPPPKTGASSLPRSDRLWDRNAVAVGGWIRSGGFPGTAREDLLRDVVALWDGFGPDHSAWNTTATLLSTLAATRDAPGDETPVFRALSELCTEIEACGAGIAGADERAVAAARRAAALVSPGARDV